MSPLEQRQHRIAQLMILEAAGSDFLWGNFDILVDEALQQLMWPWLAELVGDEAEPCE